MNRLAIIGAGVSGLAAAWALRASGLDVTLFEKSRGLSGRAATRRRNGAVYDHGAQYFKTKTPTLHRLVHQHWPREDLVNIEPAVWTFDREGTLRPGDDTRNHEGKWTYRDGISRIGKLMAAETPATILRQTRIARLDHTPAGWRLTDTDDRRYGPFDAVLVTAPAPQAAGLVEAGTLPPALHRPTLEALRAGTYRSIMALILAYDRSIPRPEDVYALVNTDKRHPISWLAFEDEKPGHAPDGQSLIVVHMAPTWTEPRFRDPVDALVTDALPLMSDLLKTNCSRPLWFDKQGWRYALPDQCVAATTLAPARRAGLFFAGDMLVGGRVHLALENGLETADALLEWFKAR